MQNDITFILQLFLKNTRVSIDSNLGHSVRAPRPAKDLKVVSGLSAVPEVIHHHFVQISFG